MTVYTRLVQWLMRTAPTTALTTIPTLADQGLHSLMTTEPRWIERIYATQYRLLDCQSLFTTLPEYTVYLQRATTALEHDQGVNALQYNTPVPTMPVWRLFLDRHGEYGDPVPLYTAWRAAAIDFLIQYRAIDAPIGTRSAHTLQVLELLLNNVVSLAALFATLRDDALGSTRRVE